MEGLANIRMDLKEIGINTRNWIDSAQDRDNWRGLEPPGSINHGVMLNAGVLWLETC